MKISTPFAYAGIAFGALFVPSVFILMAGKDPLTIWWVLIHYTLGTSSGFAEVVVHAIPLTLLGLGVAVAFRAGIFNIGGDGQLICGAVLAVAMAKILAPLGVAGAPLFLVMGFIGGGIAGAVVGWLRARFDANEIIVTIMFNYVAVQLLTWVNRGPLQEASRIFPRSYAIAQSLQLPIIVDDSRVHAGLLVALAAALAVYVLMSRTSFGFRLTVLGESPEAASYAGFNRTAALVSAMFLSGGLAGLAGAIEISAVHHRLEDGFAEGFGLAAIAVGLMARLNGLAVPLAAMLFGVFYLGAGALQRQAGVPFPIVWIIEGVVILAFLALDRAARGSASRA